MRSSIVSHRKDQQVSVDHAEKTSKPAPIFPEDLEVGSSGLAIPHINADKIPSEFVPVKRLAVEPQTLTEAIETIKSLCTAYAFSLYWATTQELGNWAQITVYKKV